jgi:CDGSH-type Zn-finger protein
MPLRIKVRQHGAYAIDLSTGDVELVDHDGNPIPFSREKPVLALCRCGMSQKKPFCDGAHKTCNIDLSILGAGPPPDSAPNTPV